MFRDRHSLPGGIRCLTSGLDKSPGQVAFFVELGESSPGYPSIVSWSATSVQFSCHFRVTVVDRE